MPSPTGTSSVTSITTTGTNYIDALLGPYKWSNKALTYSYPEYGSTYSTALSYFGGYGPQNGDGEPWTYFDTTSSSDRSYFPTMLASWANVSGLSFSLVADTAESVGEIRAAYSWKSETASNSAWAYYPSSGPSGGDIWFNTYGALAYSVWTKGSFSYFGVIHELGHALGLKHPFEGSTTLSGYADSLSFTVMSYSAYNGDQTTRLSYYPTTPMLYDIAAIQHLYGVNYNYNSTDTTYTFTDSETYHQTIWDGGGTDTIKYSGWRNATIDLDVGQGSSIGIPVYVENQYGYNVTQVKNIWIAYGTTIENATGGTGNDTISGNSSNNLIYGGSGNDSVTGGNGDDTLNGGYGSDTIYGGNGNDYLDWNSGDRYGSDYLYGGAGNDSYCLDGYSTDTIVEYYGEGTDIVYVGVSYSIASAPNVENIRAYTDATAIWLTGSSGDNLIMGGAGDDTLTGGSGNDTFQFGSTNKGTDTITDFAKGDVIYCYGASISSISAGSGSSVGYGQVQYATSGEITTLYIGTDSIPGADTTIKLQGIAGSNLGVKSNQIIFNNAPYLAAPSAITYIDTSADNSFYKTTGYLYGTDTETVSLVYGINDGSVSGLTFSKVGSYGSLTVSSIDGAYTFAPNDNAIESVKSNTSESFTVWVSDGSTQTYASLSISIVGANDSTSFSGSTSGNVKEDTTTSATGTLIVSDRDSGDATITSQTNTTGTYGSFSVGSSGTWSYTLNNSATNVQAIKGNQTVYDTFAVSTAGGSTQTITLSVSGSWETDELIPVTATRPGIYTGGDSPELIEADNANDQINAGEGNNVVNAGEGNNSILAGAGNDKITAGAGNDKIIAGAGGNTIDAGNGNNTITTLEGDDIITAGTGNDKIAAGAGNNVVDSSAGNDNITALDGNDSVSAGAGNDQVNTGAGNDTIDSGAGADKIIGGLGADIFSFANLGAGGADTISDFADEDVLRFDLSIFTSLSGATTDNLAIDKKTLTLDANDYLLYNSKTGVLSYDADGSDSAYAAIKIVSIKGTDAKTLSFDDLAFS